MRYYDTYRKPPGRDAARRDRRRTLRRLLRRPEIFSAEGQGTGSATRTTRRCGRRSASWREYFAGKRKRFEVALDPEGTPFQRSVWKAISKVGFGKTITYGELARRAGMPGQRARRGRATGRNPISIIVPCHRIVGSNGSLTGYAGGLPRKRALLALEGNPV